MGFFLRLQAGEALPSAGGRARLCMLVPQTHVCMLVPQTHVCMLVPLNPLACIPKCLLQLNVARCSDSEPVLADYAGVLQGLVWVGDLEVC
jgi:hypothetical protein